MDESAATMRPLDVKDKKISPSFPPPSGLGILDGRDTLCSCEAHGMGPKCKKRSNRPLLSLRVNIQVFTSTGIAFNFLVFGSQAFMFRRMIAEGDSTRYTALPSLSLLLCMVRDRVLQPSCPFFSSFFILLKLGSHSIWFIGAQGIPK